MAPVTMYIMTRGKTGEKELLRFEANMASNRVTIPKPVRSALDLENGDPVEIYVRPYSRHVSLVNAVTEGRETEVIAEKTL